MNPNNIFVDTNVLIGYFSNKEADERAINYLFSLKGKKLFTSALSIAQIASVFQKKTTNRKLREIITRIQAKFIVIDFTGKDITKSLEFDNADIEDNMQYVISSKFKCFYFITNNKKDYNSFNTINPLTSKEIRTINQ